MWADPNKLNVGQSVFVWFVWLKNEHKNGAYDWKQLHIIISHVPV